MRDLGPVQPLQQFQELVKGVALLLSDVIHLSYSLFPSSFLIVANPGCRSFAFCTTTSHVVLRICSQVGEPAGSGALPARSATGGNPMPSGPADQSTSKP